MMFAKHPRLAKEWAAETPDIQSLPEKVTVKPMKKKATDGRFFEDRETPQKGRFFRDLGGRDSGMFMGKIAQDPPSSPTTPNPVATKTDESSKLNIGATGAPMGGSGFRGAGMGGGMYGTGDGGEEVVEDEDETKTAESAFGQFARDPDTGKLLNGGGPPASAKPIDPYGSDTPAKPPKSKAPLKTPASKPSERKTPPSGNVTKTRPNLLSEGGYISRKNEPSKASWGDAPTPKGPAAIGGIGTNPNFSAKSARFGTGAGKTAGASPTDWDADSGMATGFHRPAHEQPEALEAGAERFHSTESNSVVPASNRQRHGLFEGGAGMTVRATSSPQMGKHAGVTRFLGTSFEKRAFMPAVQEKQDAPGAGGYVAGRANEFGDSLGKGVSSIGSALSSGVKSITKSPAAATIATILALKMGHGAGKRLVRGMRAGKAAAKVAPKATATAQAGGLIGKLMNGARDLAAGAKKYVTK